MLKNKGNKYSKLITYFVIYALGIMYIYRIYVVEILHNDVLYRVSLPKSTFKDITKYHDRGGIYTHKYINSKHCKSELGFLLC